MSEKFVNLFKNKALGKIITSREGMATANNNRFLRLWNEVKYKNIGFDFSSNIEAQNSNCKWFPYNKGGSFRKWYGNNDFIVNWKNNGFEIKNNIDKKTGRLRSHNYNGEFGFRNGITWSAISSGNISVRYSPNGYLFDSKGAKAFADQDLKYTMALINSKVGMYFLQCLSPTLDFKVGDIIKNSL